MNDSLQQLILAATGADSLFGIEEIQSLWSGYGTLFRCGLVGADFDRIVVKHVKLPDRSQHPRGWNTRLSHQRKIRSYEVESAWYQNYSELCDQRCRVPRCLALESNDTEFLIIMEDLSASGFSLCKERVSQEEIRTCLNWLAHFHATFMGRSPDSLWQVGTYWHLATRPDELKALSDGALKASASGIDQKLQDCPYQTFVHGDAKLANFCFSGNGQRVSAVDFQYVGGGCGIKDVAYFIGSCLDETACEIYETPLLDYYFEQLKIALSERKVLVDADAVAQSWRSLYRFAWADFHRFLKGWSPGHWKMHGYSERMTRQALKQLGNKTE
ncbi:phosphotransferase [Ketobacter sp. MCCC 1A13808]|uniref:phosphotransferase n=1 Tax=Ketobacter sp. MCCC 1A13808 TaxID=2602738 RepID=UPI000F1A6544|nr:phosphotransferase [Ketobacter sp. MCCC 1A13808]MVF11481.1 phosphotransferase [Ketobacter sp. MCCC 1A13808]RLP54738.1 MAG: choline kinase [Ketobacter sp.]